MRDSNGDLRGKITDNIHSQIAREIVRQVIRDELKVQVTHDFNQEGQPTTEVEIYLLDELISVSKDSL